VGAYSQKRKASEKDVARAAPIVDVLTLRPKKLETSIHVKREKEAKGKRKTAIRRAQWEN